MSDREIMDAKFSTLKNNKTPEHLFGKDILKTPLKYKHQPDAYKHQIISFIKSGIRILGYILIPYSLPIAALVLIFSEIIGIVEELV
jgi:hypothetical protein